MTRYVVIALLLALPITWAAPLPREVIGLNSWFVTRDDLAKLPYPPESEALNATEKDVSPKPGELALGLHVNGNAFVSGQSIPALIVIKNLQDKDAGLDMRFQFYDSPLFLNSCHITIRDVKSKSQYSLSHTKCWQCGSGSLSMVPANGYLCHRADFGMTPHGPLPAGEYECHWNYGRLRSNIVRFTVTESKDLVETTMTRKRTRTTVLQVMTHLLEAEEKELDDHPAGNIVLSNTALDQHRIESLAVALGSGVNDKYYPNIREIPSSDRLLKLETTWAKHQGRDQLVVTLKSVKGDQRVQFSREPTLYLLIEATEPDDDVEKHAVEQAKEGERKSHTLETPLTIDIRLTDTWKERSGQSGKVKVRVLVCSERLDLERGSGLKRVKEIVEMKATTSDAPIWSGILLSGEQTFEFPALKAKKGE